MTLAQRLYEAGYITYMRTDSTNLSNDAIGAVRTLIEKDFGTDYLPEKPNFYSKRDDNAQEAHEAIRPSDVRLQPASLKGVEADQVKLYNLIRNRFIACQMPPAKFDNTTAKHHVGIFGVDEPKRRSLEDFLAYGGRQKELDITTQRKGGVVKDRDRHRVHIGRLSVTQRIAATGQQ